MARVMPDIPRRIGTTKSFAMVTDWFACKTPLELVA
jgi:hypothetical protein